MRHFLLLFLLAGLTAPACAASGGPGWSLWVKKIFGAAPAKAPVLEKAISSQALAAQAAHRSAVLSLNPTRLLPPPDWAQPYQNMAVTSSKKIVPATEEERHFNSVNDRMAQAWRRVIERDIAVMQRRKANMLEQLQVAYPAGPVDYAALIPEEAKFIAVGEEHGFAPLRQAFETLVLQYRKKYPQRKIIILTEFVFDRTLPLSEKTGEPVSSLALRFRRVSPDFRFLEKFIKRGIPVVGLEDERYFRNHQRLISPSFRQVESVYGMKQRNDHWRRIIEQVRQQDPDAVFFIYAGNMHVHYRAPFAVVGASPQVFVLQLMAQDIGTDLPFGAVMKNEPFARVPEKTAFPEVLSWPQNSPYSVLSGFDACLIFPVSQK